MSDKLINVKIVSAGGVLYEGDAHSLSVTGIEGSLSVMSGHIPFATPTKEGKCHVVLSGGETKEFAVGKGLLTVAQSVILLTE